MTALTADTWLTEHRGSVRITVRVVPRASRSAIEGVHGDALKVRLAAPPVDGAANEALIALMAEVLRVPKSALTIVSGSKSKRKVIEAENVLPETAQARTQARIEERGSRSEGKKNRGNKEK